LLGAAPAPQIEAARFLAFACPHTIAVASWVVECSVGRAVSAKLPEPVQAIAHRFDLPVAKLGRLLIVEDAWAAAAAALIVAAGNGPATRIAGCET
jgi:NifU-like protein involved in Fe-S cluster formation